MVKDARDGSLYAHVLGFNRNSSPLLKEIKNNTSIPFITKLADADITKGLETDIQISNIYEGLKSDKYSCEYVNEFSKEIVIV